MGRRSVKLVVAALLLWSPLAVGADAEPIRGIHLSTHGIGLDWGTDAIEPTLDAVGEVGANWVAIHPYAQIGADGSVRSHGLAGGEHVTRPIREAHERGMKVFVKPHLAYWGSPFSWRGEIEFETDAQWDRFFREYQRWIVAVAAASADADGFAIGTELDRTVRFESRWREIIAAVRGATRAPITYAANWTDYDKVGFWDAVDIIGVQAYFPVAERKNAPAAEIRAGWAAVLARMRTYAAAQGKDVVFTEIGYNRSLSAAMRPWEYRSDGPDAEAHQLLCIREALDVIEAEPLVRGAFLWKWFPEPHPVGRNFALAAPAVRATVRSRWRRDP